MTTEYCYVRIFAPLITDDMARGLIPFMGKILAHKP